MRMARRNFNAPSDTGLDWMYLKGVKLHGMEAPTWRVLFYEIPPVISGDYDDSEFDFEVSANSAKEALDKALDELTSTFDYGDYGYLSTAVVFEGKDIRNSLQFYIGDYLRGSITVISWPAIRYVRGARSNPGGVIQQVVASPKVEGTRRWLGWTHLERRVKERVFRNANQQQIKLFLQEMTQLMEQELVGQSCSDFPFIIKMGTYGILVSFALGTLTLQTIMSPGPWSGVPHTFASLSLNQQVVDTLSSKLWGLQLNWKNKLLQRSRA